MRSGLLWFGLGAVGIDVMAAGSSEITEGEREVSNS
jgi:hypothetical protein